MSKLALVVVGPLVLSLLPVLTGTAHAARSVTVSFTIDHVHQVENPDTAAGDGDYYPSVKITGTSDSVARPFVTKPVIEDNDFNPHWTFTSTVNVPDTVAPNDPDVHIEVQLFDKDTGPLEGGDDHMDISPRHNDVDLDLWYNTDTNTYTPATLGGNPLSPTNDVTPNVSFSQGDGDHGFPDDNDGRIARINFSTSTGTSTDVDGDGIPDSIERLGVRNSDGSMVADLAALGADPCRQTIAMQLDWMQGAADGHSHQPKPAAISEVQAAFGAAPNHPPASPCPYGPVPAGGIQFIQIPGHGFPEAATMKLDDAYRAQRDASFNGLLRPYAHYAIFGHDQAAGDSSSGLCCDSNRDILITLGSWDLTCVGNGKNNTIESTPQGDDVMFNDPKSGPEIDVGPDRTCDTTSTGDDTQVVAVGSGAADAEVGTVREQSGSIMHELGHALGLGHGGGNKTNYKPNYLSVMNYTFDPDGVPTGPSPAPLRLDYSAKALPNLDKSQLSEAAGIGDGTDITNWTDANGKFGSGAGNVALNWNGNKTGPPANTPIIDPGTVPVNLNPNDDDPGPKQQILTGYDDWSNIQFRAAAASTAGGQSAGHPGGDIDAGTVQLRREAFQDFWAPDLSITNDDGVTTATPGSSVTYTITATNNGSAPQAGVKISDSFPSAISSDSYTATGTSNATGFTGTGSGNISDTVTMPPGSTITYIVHANISPDATGDLVNPAKVDPPAGTTDKTPSDNQATDTDHLIPVADLKAVKTGPAKVVPGTNATYTVTVSNAGPSSASDATVTDAVPSGSTFASETHPAGWTCTTPAPGSAGTITCGPARLARQTSGTFTFTVHASLGAVGTTLHNTANASSSAMDPNPGDNQSQQVDTQVKCDNNLSSASTAVTLSGGSWCVYDGKMASSVTVSAGTTAIFVRTSVGNALTARSPGTIAVCASTVRGALSVTGATGPVTIGDPGDDGCAANSLLSDVTLGSNKSSAELVGNKVSGTVTATGNSGKGPFPDDVGVEIESNSISGGLGCSGNTPVASNDHHPNSVSGSRSGQCASQTF